MCRTGAKGKEIDKTKKPPATASGFILCWRKLIFPGRHQPSIFSASELNFRVRDGNGWTLAAINTNCVCCLTGQLNYNTTLFSEMQPLFQIFLKSFWKAVKRHIRPVLFRKRSPGRVSVQRAANPGGWVFHFTCGRSVACPVQVTGYKKTTRKLRVVSFCVGENLFFRAVTSQVSSAPASLTSVFGMGTGGPSRQSTPTVFAASLDSSIIIPHSFEKCNPFFKFF